MKLLFFPSKSEITYHFYCDKNVISEEGETSHVDKTKLPYMSMHSHVDKRSFQRTISKLLWKRGVTFRPYTRICTSFATWTMVCTWSGHVYT